MRDPGAASGVPVAGTGPRAGVPAAGAGAGASQEEGDTVKLLFDVTRKDLLLIWKDKLALVWLVAIPILLMGILGSVFNFSSGSSAFRVPLPIVNQDGANSQPFTAVLSSTGALQLEFVGDEAQANKRLSDPSNAAAAYVVIPPGLGAALAGQGRAQVRLVKSPSDSSRAAAVEGILGAVVSRYAGALIAGQVAADAVQKYGGAQAPAAAVRADAMRESATLSAQPPVTIGSETARAAGSGGSPFDVIVPGYALMFALFSISGGAGSILEEQEAGTFKRLLLTPLRPWALVGGKMAAQYIMGVLQISVLMLVGIWGFGAHAGSPLGLALLVLAVPFAATGLGMLLVSVVKSRRQLQPISTAVILGSSAVGGSWFPLWLEPPWLQSASRVTLNTWAMEGFNGVMIFGKSAVEILPNVAVLVLYGLVCYLLATRLFKVRDGEAATGG